MTAALRLPQARRFRGRPSIRLGALCAAALARAALAAAHLPDGVHRLGGALADASGKPLYIWDHDTMAGMSHCESDCAQMWPPLKASAGAKPTGDWTLVTREDGSKQWAYKTKPLYTYSADRPGQAPAGESIPNWHLAR